nr:E3 SUMO-protein ligase ZBED1-like [Drosophila bipectinata]
MKTKLRDLLSNIKYCAITTDGWTSRANDHYLSVTCHFVTDNFKLKSAVLSTNKLVCDTNQNSENIADTLRIVQADWEIMHKVTAIVSDNASSMIKACKLLEKWHMPCFAHTLNLVVQDALIIGNVKEVITKCKRIVSFFKSSSIAYAKLKLAQGHDTTYGLIQEVSTRWNSCYKMIIRLLKLREAVSRVLLDTKKAPPPLTADEISILEDLERILEPFDGATNRVSGSTYETVSLIIPVSADIHHRLTSMNEGIEVRIALLEGVNQRLFNSTPYPSTDTPVYNLNVANHYQRHFVVRLSGLNHVAGCPCQTILTIVTPLDNSNDRILSVTMLNNQRVTRNGSYEEWNQLQWLTAYFNQTQ